MTSTGEVMIDTGSTSRSAPITPLLNTIVRMPMRLRAAVSIDSEHGRASSSVAVVTNEGAR